MKSRNFDRMREWNVARFGMFIHWGLYALPAGFWKGRRIRGLGEWIMHNGRIPVEEYERLARRFNPQKFDAEKIVRIARQAGMRYLVITAKHHDGFAMFKSRVDPYNIADATPYKKDIMKALARACRKYGLKFGFYYSQSQDWHEPHAAHSMARQMEGDPAKFAEYLDRKVKPQLRELLTGYGKIFLVWFDTAACITKEQSEDLVRFVHRYQPPCLVNSRVGNGLGDYSSLGDNWMPFGRLPGHWEAPATTNNTWGYRKDDHNWKSPAILLHTLAHLAGKGMNYLLNVGPTARGRIPPACVRSLRKIGRWLKVNGEAVYGSGAGPFACEFDWGIVTQKPGRLFFILNRDPGRMLILHGLKNRVKKIYWLADPGRNLDFRQVFDADIGDHSLQVMVRDYPARGMFPVLVVCLEGAAAGDGAIWPQSDGSILLPFHAAGVHCPPDLTSLNVNKPGLVRSPFGISHWRSPHSWLEWHFKVVRPGSYRARVILAYPAVFKLNKRIFEGCSLQLRCAGREFSCVTHTRKPLVSSRSWYLTEYVVNLGTLALRQRGDCHLTLHLDREPPPDHHCLVFAVELLP